MKHKNWLDEIKTPEDIEWAKNYLANRIPPQYQDFRSADPIKMIFKQLENSDSNELLRRKMKAAWDQKLTRKNNKHKASCLFVISKKAKNRLLWLSKQLKKSQSETLEIILNETFLHQKNDVAANKNGSDLPVIPGNLPYQNHIPPSTSSGMMVPYDPQAPEPSQTMPKAGGLQLDNPRSK